VVLIADVDHLGEDLQVQLARDLDDKPPAVRVVVTCGPSGRRLIAEGRLRGDLYYRLAVLVVQCPPLRERVEDVVPLLEDALRRFASRYDRARPMLAPEQMRRMEKHVWPGNVRELLNVAERAVVMGAEALDGDIIEASAPGLPKLEPGFSLANYLEGVERQILIEALRKSDGDRNAAGRLLGVERNTLRYKLNKYGLLDR
jgi:DNA-binding NtrC family response regulator